MDEDQEICRVCRCEATVKNPLYYPCKCAGSIRFVHQNCLLEWLSHSKKKYCELCEHSFSFTPIYRQDMPTNIPAYIVIKQCLSRSGTIIKTGFRALVVAIVWLVLLPYMTLWSWRFCFWSSESIGGEDLSSSMHPLSSDKHQQLSVDNSALTLFGYNLRKFLEDCFEGQVITLLIIVVLVAAYFFREWVVQNTPVEADQESEIEQNDLETLDNDSNSSIRRYQRRTSMPNTNNELQPVSPLAQQKVAVDVLLTALGNMDDNGNDTSNNMATLMTGKKDIKCRLKDLQHDLQHELEHQRKQHRFSNDDMNTLHNSGNNVINDDPYLSVNYNDEDDEAEIEYMMQSIMIKNPADAFKRYSWDDLQKSGDGQQKQRRQRLGNKQSPLSKQGNRQSIQTTSFSPPPISTSFDNTETTIIGRSSTTITALEEEYDHTNTKSASFSREQHELPRTTTRTDLYCTHPHSANRLPTTQTITSPTKKKHRLGGPPTNSADGIISRPLISEQSTTATAAMEPSQLSSLNERCPFAAPHNLEIDDHHHAGPSQQAEQNENNIHAHEPLETLDVNDEIVDDDEDDAFDLGNDIEGVLEAIGMRGNPWILLQNSVLVCVIITLCLGVGIWIPHLTGRLVILVRPISLIEKMIYTLRYVTDPITDGIIDGCFPLLWLAIKNLDSWLPGNLISIGRPFLTDSMAMIEIGTKDGYLSLLSSGLHNGGMRFSSSGSLLSGKNDTTAMIHHLLLADQQRMVDVNHWLGRFMNTAHSILERMSQSWYQFAMGKSAMDRGMCIVVGYITLFMVGSWYFSYYYHQQQQQQQQQQQCSNSDSGDEKDNFYRTTTKTTTYAGIGGLILQQGIFFKVFFFIIMELVLLPMVCGILLDLVTLPLIENSSITSRWDFTMTHPYCGCFLHWFVGAGFMSLFAVFITLCREIVRPGVMWFIRDSNDPQFHPVQEIMERPLLLLFRKLCTGVLTYLLLIVFGMGSVTWAVSRYTGIFPLRLSFNDPLSTLAIGILAAQFLVPFFVAYIKPRDFSKHVLILWWHTSSRWLRLSSFMFGERYPDEEGTFAQHTVKPWLYEKSSILVPGRLFLSLDENGTGKAYVSFKADGQLVRVPKQDYVMADSARSMIVPVDPKTLETLDPMEMYLGDSVSSDENGGQEYNTTIVYIPPQFKLRIVFFFALMWFFVSILTCSITVIPLFLGRSLVDTYIAPDNPVHDLYSFALGLCIVILLSKATSWISQGSEYYCKRDELGGWLSLLDKTRTHLRQKLINGCKVAYLTLTIGWIIPLLVGMAIDLYVFTPFRYTNANDQALVLHLSEDWSFGVVCLGVVYGIIYILPTNYWQGTLDRYTGNALMAQNIWTLTRTILGPCILGVMCTILVPGGLACLAIYFFDVQNVLMKLTIIRFVYPIVFGVALVLSTLALGAKLTRLWMQSIRDNTYLVGRQLHNLEDDH